MSAEEILKIKEVEYGSAQFNFEQIGRGWGAILGIEDIPAWQVALMMDFFKSIRISRNHAHTDSWLDKEGYTALGKGIVFGNEYQ